MFTAVLDRNYQVTNIQYDYDPLYRLTSAVYSGDLSANYSYTYDAVGNMTAYVETVGTATSSVSRTFNDANQLVTSSDTELGTASFYYDDNGNMTMIIKPGDPQERLYYHYNQRNLLVLTEEQQGTGPTLPVAEFVYDGDANRLQQIDRTGSQPTTTTYTNDIVGLSQVLVSNDGATTTYNLFGLDLISQDNGNETRTLLADGLGSTRLEMVVDFAGTAVIQTTTTYEPYGKLLSQTGLSGTTYGFTGEQYDPLTSLVYLRARYYNPSLKIFLSRDPFPGILIMPASQHGYSYVHNNSINFIDPTGHRECGTPYELSCSNRPIPEWWIDGTRRLYVEGYGVFDTWHIERGYRHAEWFIGQTQTALIRGGGEFDEPALSSGGLFRGDYSVSYSVSGNVTPDQVEGVAYGMFIDFEFGYEELQSGRIDFYSSYSPEDLPSDHIGFWAYMNDRDWNEIPGVLESLGHVTPWQGGSLLMDTIVNTAPTTSLVFAAILCFPRNHDVTPMERVTEYYEGGSYETRWQNRPWPEWLQITPIQSGPSTWQRVD